MLAVHALSAGAQAVYYGLAIASFAGAIGYEWVKRKRFNFVALGLGLATFVFFMGALAAS